MNTRLPDFNSMLSELIAAPSVSCTDARLDQGNRGVLEPLANWLEALGFAVRLQAVDAAQEKFNLIARAGPGEDGLLLAGHTDTVPCNEPLWQSDPYRLEQRDGRLYGLGATDMKGFFPLLLEVLNGIDLKRLQRPVTVVATADEETSMQGARLLAASGEPLGRYALIGEPTGLQPVHLHKGILMEAIVLHGQSGHSSDPGLGNNALEGMSRVIADLQHWRQQLQHRHQHPGFEVSVPTLNLGCIHGGDNPNRICGDCELQIDIRPIPGLRVEDLRRQLHQRVHDVLADSGLEIGFRTLFNGIEAMETPSSSALVQTLQQLSGRTSGSVAFGTEGPIFNELGMQTVIYGPGSIDQAHQPDEYLALDRIAPAARVLTGLIQRVCLSDCGLA